MCSLGVALKLGRWAGWGAMTADVWGLGAPRPELAELDMNSQQIEKDVLFPSSHLPSTWCGVAIPAPRQHLLPSLCSVLVGERLVGCNGSHLFFHFTSPLSSFTVRRWIPGQAEDKPGCTVTSNAGGALWKHKLWENMRVKSQQNNAIGRQGWWPCMNGEAQVNYWLWLCDPSRPRRLAFERDPSQRLMEEVRMSWRFVYHIKRGCR